MAYNPGAYNNNPDYYDYFTNTADGYHRSLGGHDIVLTLQTPSGHNRPIGRAQSLAGRRDFGVEQVYEIGSMKPQEFVPLRYSGSITLNRYLIREEDLVGLLKATQTPFSLSNEGKILLQSVRGLSVEVRDQYTGKIIRKYRNCVVSACDEDFRAGAIRGETMTLLYSECETYADEQEDTTATTELPFGAITS